MAGDVDGRVRRDDDWQPTRWGAESNQWTHADRDDPRSPTRPEKIKTFEAPSDRVEVPGVAIC